MTCAGRSVAAEALENAGFYRSDNVPPALIPDLYRLCERQDIEKAVVVTGAKEISLFSELSEAIEKMRGYGMSFSVLFLDCDDTVLFNRYRETRRTHPLSEKYAAFEEALASERKMLEPLRRVSGYNIDTTCLSASQLRERVGKLFGENEENGFTVNIQSFGFKYGVCREGDLVFDVRFLSNPYYVPHLKNLTGLDTAVRDYIMSFEESGRYLEKLYDMIDFLLPLYRKAGKRELVIGFGCTGGKHRSVTCAFCLAEHLEKAGVRVVTTHRDILKH